jgi:hypothetical protein
MLAAERDHVWRRRWLALALTVMLSVGLPLAFGHRGTHMAMNLMLPGAGLFGVDSAVAIIFVVAAIGAVAVWFRWGLDWSVAAVIVAAMAASATAVHGSSSALGALMQPPPVQRSAHEFPLVLIVVGALSRLGRIVRRLPPVAAIRRRRADRNDGLAALGNLPVVERCRAASIAALADLERVYELDMVVAAIRRPDVARRARRIGTAARARVGGDPFRVDHAHARTALVLTGQLDCAALDRFVADAETAAARVPCSEPGWVRPLDATLAAAALHRVGRPDAASDLRALFSKDLPLRRGHRPAWWWTVLGLAGGSCPAWEHAASTGIARAIGAVGDADWPALRTRAFGAAARGTKDAHDERLIAAARVWLAFVDDAAAAAIVSRPTVRHDPVAVALDRLATRLRSDRDAIRRPVAAAIAR